MIAKKELFESTPVPEAIWKLALPAVLGQIILVLYNMADTFFVGLTGSDPMLSAGVTFKLGSGVSPHTMSRTALTKELNAVQQQNQVLAVKNQQLESDVETLKAQVRQLLASLHTPSK